MMLSRSYKTTFGIFPALIPLIEILPWVLGAIGALAGGTQAFKAYWDTHKQAGRSIRILAALSLVSAIGLYVWQDMRIPDKDVGSNLVQTPQDLPRWTGLGSVQSYAANNPQHKTHDLWTTGAPQQIWSQHSPEELLGTPVIASGMIMMGNFKGVFESYDSASGQKLWSVQKSQPIFTSPAIGKERIYIGEGLHTADKSGLTALSIPDGKPLWEREFASHLEAPPALDEEHDRLWIGAGSLGLWALDTDDGDKLWWAKIGHIDISPLYTQGRLLIAAKLDEERDGSAFFNINPDSGDVIEKIELAGNPMGKIMDTGNGTFIVSTAIGQVGLNKPTDKGWVYGIDLNHSKKIRWMHELPTMAIPEGQIGVGGTIVFFTLKDGTVVAIDTRSGAVIWNKKCGAEFKSDLAVYEEGHDARIIAQTTDGYVHIIDARTGADIQKLKFESGSYAAPVYTNGVLYISTHHNIYALDITKAQK